MKQKISKVWPRVKIEIGYALEKRKEKKLSKA